MSICLRFVAGVKEPKNQRPAVFSALTLLVGHQEEHLAVNIE